MFNKKHLPSFDLKTWHWFLILAILTIFVRCALFFVLVPYNPVAQDRDEYLAIARHVIEGKGISITWDNNITVQTSKRGPIPVLFFAFTLFLFGDHTLSIAFGNWFIDAITTILLFLIGRDIFGDKKIALVTSLLFVFYIPEIYYSWQALSEPLFTMLLAAFVLTYLKAVTSPSKKIFIVAAVFLGLATLTRPIAGYFLPIAILGLIWFNYKELNVIIKWGLTLGIGWVLVILPWVIRNHIIFDEFIPTNSNSGITLYHGNYALGEDNYLRTRTHIEGGISLNEKIPNLDKLTQPQHDRFAREAAFSIIKKYPGRYLTLSIVRFFKMWYFIQGPSASKSILVLIFHLFLLSLAAIAFISYQDEWFKAGIFLIVLILINNVVSAAVRVNTRYIISFVPYVMLFSAVTIVHLAQQLSQPTD